MLQDQPWNRSLPRPLSGHIGIHVFTFPSQRSFACTRSVYNYGDPKVHDIRACGASVQLGVIVWTLQSTLAFNLVGSSLLEGLLNTL